MSDIYTQCLDIGKNNKMKDSQAQLSKLLRKNSYFSQWDKTNKNLDLYLRNYSQYLRFETFKTAKVVYTVTPPKQFYIVSGRALAVTANKDLSTFNQNQFNSYIEEITKQIKKGTFEYEDDKEDLSGKNYFRKQVILKAGDGFGDINYQNSIIISLEELNVFTCLTNHYQKCFELILSRNAYISESLCKILPGLDKNEIANEISSLFKENSFNSFDEIFQRNKEINKFYILRQGFCELFIENTEEEDNQEKLNQNKKNSTIAIKQGELFGHEDYSDTNHIRSFSCRAISPNTVIYEIKIDYLLNNKNPKVRTLILQNAFSKYHFYLQNFKSKGIQIREEKSIVIKPQLQQNSITQSQIINNQSLMSLQKSQISSSQTQIPPIKPSQQQLLVNNQPQIQATPQRSQISTPQSLSVSQTQIPYQKSQNSTPQGSSQLIQTSTQKSLFTANQGQQGQKSISQGFSAHSQIIQSSPQKPQVSIQKSQLLNIQDQTSLTQNLGLPHINKPQIQTSIPSLPLISQSQVVSPQQKQLNEDNLSQSSVLNRNQNNSKSLTNLQLPNSQTISSIQESLNSSRQNTSRGMHLSGIENDITKQYKIQTPLILSSNTVTSKVQVIKTRQQEEKEQQKPNKLLQVCVNQSNNSSEDNSFQKQQEPISNINAIGSSQTNLSVQANIEYIKSLKISNEPHKIKTSSIISFFNPQPMSSLTNIEDDTTETSKIAQNSNTEKIESRKSSISIDNSKPEQKIINGRITRSFKHLNDQLDESQLTLVQETSIDVAPAQKKKQGGGTNLSSYKKSYLVKKNIQSLTNLDSTSRKEIKPPKSNKTSKKLNEFMDSLDKKVRFNGKLEEINIENFNNYDDVQPKQQKKFHSTSVLPEIASPVKSILRKKENFLSVIPNLQNQQPIQNKLSSKLMKQLDGVTSQRIVNVKKISQSQKNMIISQINKA